MSLAQVRPWWWAGSTESTSQLPLPLLGGEAGHGLVPGAPGRSLLGVADMDASRVTPEQPWQASLGLKGQHLTGHLSLLEAGWCGRKKLNTEKLSSHFTLSVTQLLCDIQ